ncbi:MAG: tetratricopeptide repeat protein, partial [Candidatus Omnitrophica bacterium]|nr:tetratricopeptide repeat protein [Candidatus Omnitrophota bacterium]
FPSDLHYYRSIDILAPHGWAWVRLAGIAIGVKGLWKFLSGDEQRLAGLGLGWFLLGLFPVLNIVPLVNEYSFLAAAEHNLYFPLMGFLMLFTAVGLAVAGRSSSRLMVTGKLFVVLLIIILAIASMIQTRFWKSESVLFSRAARFEPGLGRVRILLAKAYFKEGKYPQSIEEYNRAANIMNRYLEKAVSEKSIRFYQGMLKGIYSDSAQAFAAVKDFDSAIAHYNRALSFDPSDSYLYSNRALSFIAKKDMPAGMGDLQVALKLDPDNLYAANNLSLCLIQQGELMRAREILRGIVSKDPNFLAARKNLNQLESQLTRRNGKEDGNSSNLLDHR